MIQILKLANVLQIILRNILMVQLIVLKLLFVHQEKVFINYFKHLSIC